MNSFFKKAEEMGNNLMANMMGESSPQKKCVHTQPPWNSGNTCTLNLFHISLDRNRGRAKGSLLAMTLKLTVASRGHVVCADARTLFVGRPQIEVKGDC
jgi:hypothetical protein